MHTTHTHQQHTALRLYTMQDTSNTTKNKNKKASRVAGRGDEHPQHTTRVPLLPLATLQHSHKE